MMHRVPILLVVAALVLFVSMPAFAQKDSGDTHEGTVVSATATKLVMKDKDGKQHSHTVANDAQVMIDNKAGKLEDLKPGQKIRVTTKKGDATTAIKVEALDKNKDFGGSK